MEAEIYDDVSKWIPPDAFPMHCQWRMKVWILTVTSQTWRTISIGNAMPKFFNFQVTQVWSRQVGSVAAALLLRGDKIEKTYCAKQPVLRSSLELRAYCNWQLWKTRFELYFVREFEFRTHALHRSDKLHCVILVYSSAVVKSGKTLLFAALTTLEPWKLSPKKYIPCFSS